MHVRCAILTPAQAPAPDSTPALVPLPTADIATEVALAPAPDRTIWSDLRQARQAARNETPTPATPPARVEGNPGYAFQGASTAILIAVPQAVAATASVAQVTTGYGFLSPQGTGANYFRVLPVAELSVDALTNLLQSRTAYKKELFSDAIAQLVRNPDMADVPSCADGAGGLAGTCLLQPEGREADQAMQATAVDRTRIEERAAPRPARRSASFPPHRRAVRPGPIPGQTHSAAHQCRV